MFYSYIKFIKKNIIKKKYDKIIRTNNFIIGKNEFNGGSKSCEELKRLQKKSMELFTNLKDGYNANSDEMKNLINYIDALYLTSYISDLVKVNNSITDVINKLDNELKETS